MKWLKSFVSVVWVMVALVVAVIIGVVVGGVFLRLLIVAGERATVTTTIISAPSPAVTSPTPQPASSSTNQTNIVAVSKSEDNGPSFSPPQLPEGGCTDEKGLIAQGFDPRYCPELLGMDRGQ